MSLSTVKRVGLMQHIESLLQQLDGESDPMQVRIAIADLIVDYLQSMKDSMGYWEKAYLASAIAALALDGNSLRQPTTAWLRLSLIDLEKVLAPANLRQTDGMLEDKQLESLTFEQLLEATESVRQTRT